MPRTSSKKGAANSMGSGNSSAVDVVRAGISSFALILILILILGVLDIFPQFSSLILLIDYKNCDHDAYICI